jgi:hypothetical protein
MRTARNEHNIKLVECLIPPIAFPYGKSNRPPIEGGLEYTFIAQMKIHIRLEESAGKNFPL